MQTHWRQEEAKQVHTVSPTDAQWPGDSCESTSRQSAEGEMGQLLPCYERILAVPWGPVQGTMTMANMTTVEIKAFVPAKDFDLSKQFYRDLGFDLAWSDDHLAEFRHGNSSFLLQNFYNEVHAGNFMMHLLVEDVDAWWQHVQDQGLAANYSVHAEPPADRGGMRDFILVDPTGVLWRVGQNLVKAGTATQSADNR